jgi:outer membrane protein OmpA-like peptidoglycan-associated protein
MNPAIRGLRSVVGRPLPVLMVSFVAGLAACAGTRMPPKELTDARDEVLQARDAASRLDPTDVHEADLALLNAERAWQNDPDSMSAIDLALIAQRKAQIAEAEAQAAQASNRAAVAKQQMQALAATQLADVQGRLGQTERQLDQTQDQLQQQKQSSDLQRARLADMETKLRNARATIAKIATIRDDDRGMVITLQGELLFKTGQWELKPAAMAKLDEIAEALKGDEQPIDVVGHTDNVGTRANNMDLSQKRAGAVRDYLVEKGIPQDLIRAEGHGPDNPAADNGSVEGRATNRRVELVVEPKK